jgi:gliding motility-associated protein GldC
MKQSEIKFNITLDDNNLPQNIDWSATDGGVTSNSSAIMLSVWDNDAHNTLRIDLWTREMKVDEMKQFYHQTLLSMSDSLERATGDKDAAKEMRKFAKDFGVKLKLIKK